MRLAQIARKVGMTPTEIRRFIEGEFQVEIGNEPNYKLNEDQIDAVLQNFTPVEKEPEVAPKKEEIPPVETTVEEVVETVPEIAEVEATTPLEAETEAPEVTEEIAVEAEAVIEEEDTADTGAEEVPAELETVTEDQDEEAPFVEAEVDPDAELIKAPKIKLDGLKILGKIELPEKKEVEPEKTEEELEAEEAEKIAALDAAMQSQAQDVRKKGDSKADKKEEQEVSEYKDKNGIYHFSHQQKVNREKRLIELDIKRKRENERNKKKQHYQEMMQGREQKSSVKAEKLKARKTAATKEKKAQKTTEAPKGLWAKFLRWLND